MSKALPGNRKMFGVNRVDFLTTQKRALREALRQTRLTPQEIAYALGAHGDTFLNWVNGKGRLDPAAIDPLDKLFCSVGYYQFFPDMFGEVFTRRRERVLRLEKEAERMRAHADLMEAVA
jgi:hypothetical protein